MGRRALPTKGLMFFAQILTSMRVNRRNVARVAMVSTLLLCGIALSLLLFAHVRTWEDRALQTEVENRARERGEILRAKILSSMDVLHSIDSLFVTRRQVSRQEFAAFVASALKRQPELCALGWTPRVAGPERAEFEQAAPGWAEGLPIYSARPSGPYRSRRGQAGIFSHLLP